MTRVTVSTKFQVVIPLQVRRLLALKSGEQLSVIVKEGVITLIPDQPLRRLRGLLRGVASGGLREKKDRA